MGLDGDLKGLYQDLSIRVDKHLASQAETIGKKGVEALKEATPKRTGKTANSWEYEVSDKNGVVSVTFTNSNVTADGYPIPLLIESGHANRSGHWTEGHPFIAETLNDIINEGIDNVDKEMR